MADHHPREGRRQGLTAGLALLTRVFGHDRGGERLFVLYGIRGTLCLSLIKELQLIGGALLATRGITMGQRQVQLLLQKLGTHLCVVKALGQRQNRVIPFDDLGALFADLRLLQGDPPPFSTSDAFSVWG